MFQSQPERRVRIVKWAWVLHAVIAFNHYFGHLILVSSLIATLSVLASAQIAFRLKDERLFFLNVSVLPLALEVLLVRFVLRSRFYAFGGDVLLPLGIGLVALYILASFALAFTTAKSSVFLTVAGAVCYIDPFVFYSLFFLSGRYQQFLPISWSAGAEQVADTGGVVALVGLVGFIITAIKDQFGHRLLSGRKSARVPHAAVLGGNVPEESMSLPAEWNEIEIGAALSRLSGDQNRLFFYANQIVSRFVDGQMTTTAQYRLEFLKKQSELLRAGLENYKLRREIRRTVHHEDAADIRARAAVAAAERDVALDELKTQAETERYWTQIEEDRKKRVDLNKPEEVVAPPPEPEDPAAAKKRNRDRVQKEITEIDVHIKAIKDDPSKDDATKRRFINLYEDKREKLYEELRDYL